MRVGMKAMSPVHFSETIIRFIMKITHMYCGYILYKPGQYIQYSNLLWAE